MSNTTQAELPAESAARRISCFTMGWMIASSSDLALGSSNAWSRILWRSSAPSLVKKSAPNWLAIAGMAAPPGKVHVRAMASASINVAPQATNISATVLLPLPMPPVRPSRNTSLCRSEPQDGKNCLGTKKQRSQTSESQKRTEGHISSFAQLCKHLDPNTYHGADY